ncbi:MAG: Nif3-like dinuclear metal center hexameric protein [Spirochaetia bacterium]|nr:Nif3-like dinuclear metal center hexameric protein [Spirochaetia bacterium]
MNNKSLENYLNTLMAVNEFKDYCPNGLQIEGASEIKRILTSPSISLAVMNKAIELGAEAILVHHGMFWEHESRKVTGPCKERLKLMLNHNINLFAYHLPLDFLNEYGNNAPVLRDLKLSNIKPFENTGYSGKLKTPMDSYKFSILLDKYYHTTGFHIPKNGKIQHVAIVSGNGVSYLQKAIDQGFDAFITGENSEWVYNLAIENNIAFSSMGHYKSECIGVKLLGGHLEKKFKIKVDFFSEENPF